MRRAIPNTSSGINPINPVDTTAPNYLEYDGKTGITIHLAGKGGRRIVSLEGTGILFIVGSGVTLELDHNLTLKGHDANTSQLVLVYDTLIMNEGAVITGNTRIDGPGGGGVYVGGTFTMNGGTISGNTSSGAGGGVYVSGTFTMNGGTISGNTPDDVKKE